MSTMGDVKLAPIYDPGVRKPAPHAAQVDLRVLFWAGTILWVIAAVVYGILMLLGHQMRRELHTCLFGVLIGALLLVWEFLNRKQYRLFALFPQS